MPAWLWVSIDKQAAGVVENHGSGLVSIWWEQVHVVVCDGDVNVSDWNDIHLGGNHQNGSARDTPCLPLRTKLGTLKWGSMQLMSGKVSV